MRKNKILLSALLTNALIFGGTSQAIQVEPSCDGGAYSVFDLEQCQPPKPQEEQPVSQPEQNVVEKKEVEQSKQVSSEGNQETQPEMVEVQPSQTVIERKERFFTDWGPYKQKSPQELLETIKELLSQQAPVVSYPQNAPVGCCYGKMVKPPTYKEILIKYVKEDGGYEVKVQPAQFKEVEKKILVRPAYYKIEVIPAKYKTVQEKVIIAPARAIWTYHNGIYCKVEVPAEYATLERKVMVQPPQCKKVLVPAEYKVIKVKELVKDASCNKKSLPPKYDLVKKTVKVKGPEVIWDAVLCDINLKPMQIKQIQAKLKELGYYNGPISGELDDATMAAVVKFQVDHNLPAGNISIETLEKMGLKDLAQSYIKCEVKNLK
jgi:hypothetical protein